MTACLTKAEEVCESRIRPMLRRHGGDIRILDYEEASGLLRFELLGRCVGCPAASLSTEEQIRSILTEAVPEIREVVLVEPVSDELLCQARELLGIKA